MPNTPRNPSDGQGAHCTSLELMDRAASMADYARRNWLPLAGLVAMALALDQLLPSWTALALVLVGILLTVADLISLRLDPVRRRRRIALSRRHGWISPQRALMIEHQARTWQRIARRWVGTTSTCRDLRTRAPHLFAAAHPRWTRRMFRHRTPRRAVASAAAGDSDGEGGGGDPGGGDPPPSEVHTPPNSYRPPRASLY